jgi:hypothetical protein
MIANQTITISWVHRAPWRRTSCPVAKAHPRAQSTVRQLHNRLSPLPLGLSVGSRSPCLPTFPDQQSP